MTVPASDKKVYRARLCGRSCLACLRNKKKPGVPGVPGEEETRRRSQTRWHPLVVLVTRRLRQEY